VDSRVRDGKPKLIQVTDRVFCANRYSVSNALFVLTERSIVVIDTTESISAARAALCDLRKTSDLPVSHIIYTHFHGDHIRGAKALHTPGVKIIAQKRMPEELARNKMLLPYRERVNAIQLGTPLPATAGGSLLNDSEDGYVPPDVLFEEELRFEEGGMQFELFHTQGESADHLMVWLPREKILFPGDLFYRCFPMLSNPLKADRPVGCWIESLERMRRLGAEYLVPSHSAPIHGAGEIDMTLANYARAIRHVHDETVKGINEHLTLDQILNRVRLPENLARLQYLTERYGTVRWAAKGIYRQYTGWYDFNPAHLNPGPRRARSAALLEAAGWPAPFVASARRALDAGDNQTVLELTEIVLDVRPRHQRALALRLAALTRLANTGSNALERNMYRAAAKSLSQAPTERPGTKLPVQTQAVAGIDQNEVRTTTDPPNELAQREKARPRRRKPIFRSKRN
jgi:alkyl sulfatase BDS1-like metallo-beta-lactamase superfamily hydrolase